MKAIRVHQFGDPQVLQLDDIPTPAPQAGQILVRLHAVGVNPVETYIRAGTYARKPDLPYTPGSDGAGVVEALGPDVPEAQHLTPGRRVYIAGAVTGAYAQYALCMPAQVHPLPENQTFAQGAAVGIPYATAYRALVQRAAAQPGESVLIHGATGGVGLAAVQIARMLGMTALGTFGSSRGKELLIQQGVEPQHLFDHRDDDRETAIIEATDGRGVDIVLEMLANANLARDLSIIATGGRIVVIGSRGPIEINPRDAMAREAAILGMVLFNADDAQRRRIHAALGAGLRNGSLNPIIAAELPLADAPRAHEMVMQTGATGKIILLPS